MLPGIGCRFTKGRISMMQVVQNTGAAPLQAFSESIAATVERIGRSTVAVRGRGRHALGCGVAWRAGILVTAAHVFGRAPAAISVVAAGPQGGDATLVGTDAPTDLAVFRMATPELPAPEVAASGPRAGELAILVGRSQGGDPTASVTVVNRVSGAWESWLGGRIDQLIRLDAGLHDGQSGAPVADCNGRVFGIATSALSRTHGVVVPEATISRVVDELLSKGHVARAFLGISAQSVRMPDAPASAAAPETAGLLITSLLPGGPAAQAGLLVGDIVVDVAQHRAASVPQLRDALAGNIGKAVRVSLIRGGVPTQLDVTVGQWPAEARAC
jgi:serine protease Do